ncbi:DOMON domain-containing protein FRRS1L isoform X6 [Crotalus tigris]|uniref:DOMON domain-containing protein FRRS1L isoform X6 n=1 Tax=Crotalus tigris TaxID=88082 RepID=UPI00192FAD89|nr:DOMON domain-containing protein FRRS1L isoform X6 [Crotalus tigris]
MAAFAAILSWLHWCSLWMLLGAASTASSWAIIADENTGNERRSVQGRDAKGNQPDEKHQSHDSSYGTFASEFYDTRFLSDEGYPFPTAPPVDPFAKIRADDCGKTKGCFRYGKPGCAADTCDYFLSYRRIGADIEFELSAEADGWVAVGFSSDKKMGGDDVMACVHDDNGRVRIHHFYNVGQWAKEIQRNPARDEEGSITRHDIDSPPVSEHVVSIYKYEDIFMPSAAYQTFSSPLCLLLIVALTFYILMGTP